MSEGRFYTIITRQKPKDNIGKINTHCTKERYIESSSVATAAKWAIWGMGSTIATMATLWCTMVDTGTLVIGSYTGVDARRRCMVTARGGWRGHDWDESIGYGEIVGRIDMICGMHCGSKGGRGEIGMLNGWVTW